MAFVGDQAMTTAADQSNALRSSMEVMNARQQSALARRKGYGFGGGGMGGGMTTGYDQGNALRGGGMADTIRQGMYGGGFSGRGSQGGGGMQGGMQGGYNPIGQGGTGNYYRPSTNEGGGGAGGVAVEGTPLDPRSGLTF